MKSLVLVIILTLSLPYNLYSAGEDLVGSPVPTFVLPDEDNRNVDFGTLIDRPTIIYFTHNACHYCTQIIAHLKRAEAKFGKDKLRIIGINIMARDSRLVRAYKKEMGFTFPMFAGNRDDLLKRYRINYVPVLVFVDSKRLVRRVVGHYIHEPELHRLIKEIMGERG
ncbi:MAG: TlpA family protein disulfide reductase [Thermodesulfovibrionales bacterium]